MIHASGGRILGKMKGIRAQVSKPAVIRSINDTDGARCVDILREGEDYFWVECRRDPEDSHGWRYLGERSDAFATEIEALGAAKAAIGWME